MDFTKQIIDAAPYPMYIKDAEGKIVQANTAYATLLRHRQTALDFAIDRDQEVINSGSSTSFEEYYKLQNQSGVWYHTTKNIFKHEDGTVYLLSISTDITYLKKERFPTDKPNKFYNHPSNKEAPAITIDVTSTSSQGLASLSTGNTLCVALSNDNGGIQLMAKIVFQKFGLLIDVAFNSEETLLKVAEKKYGLILLEIISPVKEALKIVSHIRSISDFYLRVPIIALTANKYDFDNERYFGVDLTDWLPIPCNEEELYGIILKYSFKQVPDIAQNMSKYFSGKERPYDFSGLGGLGNDEVFIQKMQQLFIASVPEQLKDLTEAIKESNWETVAYLAHRLKSTYGNLRMEGPVSDIREIENIILSKSEFERLPNLLQSVHKFTDKVCCIFAKELNFRR